MAEQTTTESKPAVQQRIETLTRQRDEWQNYTCIELCDVVERILRDLYSAAFFTAKARGSKDIDGLFRKIIVRLPSWSDQDMIEEFTDSPTATPEERKSKAERVEEYIKTTVWAQATLMSLSSGKRCREIIRVPNAPSFLRSLLSDVAFDHDTKVFCTISLPERTELKKWINACIKKKLLSLVPVTLFIADATTTAPVQNPPPIVPKTGEEPVALKCDGESCSLESPATTVPETPPQAEPEPEEAQAQAEEEEENEEVEEEDLV